MDMRFSFLVPVAMIGVLLICFTSCTSSIFNVRAKQPYRYELKYGESVLLRNGYAIVPKHAPPAVHRMVTAGNMIKGLPYKLGGGHKRINDNGYDCSGAVSYVLIKAGLLGSPMTSNGFKKYGRRGKGDWVTIYAKNGHTFLVVGGLRFDTGYNGQGRGPKWTVHDRPTRGHVMRHPVGL
tara:strand:+ start:343 stop:882 length:540 start_codon:yes stop_codon:yes gene_type:complete